MQTVPAAKAELTRTRLPLKLLYQFGAVLFVALLALGARDLRKQASSASWPSTPGRVLQRMVWSGAGSTPPLQI
jgi:hypothetical protein